MTLVTTVKYLVPLTLFFYGTVIIHFIRETNEGKGVKFHAHLTYDARKVLDNLEQVLQENHNSQKSVLAKKFNSTSRNFMQPVESSTPTVHQSFKNVNRLALKNDASAQGKLQIKQKNLQMRWDASEKLKLSGKEIKHYKGNSFHQVGNNIYVLSAFFDYRQLAIYNETCIRIIAIARQDSNESLVCRMKNGIFDQMTEATKAEMSDNHEMVFGGVMYTCKIPPRFGYLPPKIIYLHSVTYQKDSFSKVTNKFISETAVLVKIFQQNKIIHSETINYPGEANLWDSPNISEDKWKKTLLENRQKVKNAIGAQGRPLWNRISMLHTNEMELSAQVSVCVSPLFGSASLSELIQFIEIHLILGVRHFFFYKMKVSSEIEQMLDLYQSKGLVTVLDWILPIPPTQIWYNGQVVALQDCLYRNIGQFNYTAFVDLDEVVVPYKDITWQEMLYRFDRNQLKPARITHFTLQSAFFPPDVSNENMHSTTKSYFNKMSFLKNINKNKVLSSVRTKVIVKPDYIEQMGIHHVSKLILSNTDLRMVAVPSDVALIHHYRKCTQVSDDKMHCGNYVEDTSLWKYADVFIQNFDNTLEEFLSVYRKIK